MVRGRDAKATVGDVVATKDGYVGLPRSTGSTLARLLRYDRAARVGRRPVLDPVVNRTERADELNPVIRAWCMERTTAEIVDLAALFPIPAIEVGNGATIPAMPHFAEGAFYDVNPDGGFLQPAAPFRFHPRLPGVGECQPARGSGG